MAECEICGAEDADYITLIEGAKLRTCTACARGGKVLKVPERAPVRRGPPAVVKRGKLELDIVSDFGSRIVTARKRMHIERKVLAELINEKESFLDRVERGKSMPNEMLARKLEKELGIKLFEEDSADTYAPVPKGEKKGLTLGDIVMLKKKEDEEGK
ncbi:MAG: TIGR00270 family protein [Candidatus Aenigmarchaeota archaeon]|nr:TIGR00270 family protein [Candidatus Aenigmarchaeota archaeon]